MVGVKSTPFIFLTNTKDFNTPKTRNYGVLPKTPGKKWYYFSSRTMVMAFFGHSFAQIPHPLQNPRSISRSSLIAWSGQYIAQRPHWLHFSLSTTGRNTRHEPVLPQAPTVGLLNASRSLIPPAPCTRLRQLSHSGHLKTSLRSRVLRNPLKRSPSSPVHR